MSEMKLMILNCSHVGCSLVEGFALPRRSIRDSATHKNSTRSRITAPVALARRVRHWGTTLDQGAAHGPIYRSNLAVRAGVNPAPTRGEVTPDPDRPDPDHPHSHPHALGPDHEVTPAGNGHTFVAPWSWSWSGRGRERAVVVVGCERVRVRERVRVVLG